MSTESGKWLQLMNSVLLSIVRASVGLPYEHPLDTVKTIMQSQEHRATFR